MKKKGRFEKVLNGFNFTRLLILNLLFWVVIPLIIIISIATVSRAGRVNIHEGAVLNLELNGTIVDRYSDGEWDRRFQEMMENPTGEMLLSDILKVIDNAEKDDRISAVILRTDGLIQADLASLEAIRKELEEFRSSGKKIVAYSENYSQRGYYLASVADEIIMDSMGSVNLRGLGVRQSYYKQGLEKIGVEVAVFRTGEYKSFVEPFTETGMSPGVKEQTLSWLNSIWGNMVDDISKSRNIPKKKLIEEIENYNERLDNSWNCESKMAQNSHLIDKIMTSGEFNDYISYLGGMNSPLEIIPEPLYWNDYLSSIESDVPIIPSKNNIAVVVAEGDIVYGYADRGVIASHSYSDLFDTIAQDNSIVGVVLRINSGGGSAVAAEHIRRSVEQLEKKGIPVVASFGGVAASGGYWIGSGARYIFAEQTTITGSIGVFSMIPLLGEAMEERLGITFDGVGTTSRSLDGDIMTPLSESEQAYYRKSVNGIYARFKELVTKSRNIDPETFEEIAGGRVWSGEQAKKLSLIDRFGGIDDAVAYIAEQKNLEDYSVVYYEPEPVSEPSLLSEILRFTQIKFPGSFEEVYRESLKAVSPDFNDPKGIFAYFSYSLNIK